MKRSTLFLQALFIGILIVLSTAGISFGQETEAQEIEKLGTQLPIWSIIPFIGILLSIALFPLFAPEFWHHHYGKISALWSIILAVPFIIFFRGEAVHEILFMYIRDYIPFIILLWALYTITGGILIQGDLWGSPGLNTLLLLFGTFLASWIGTTGASILLIRPLLRINKIRKTNIHVIIFFIFLVSNVGGSLTPLGDPPLFIGFLHGVPFFWTFKILPDLAFNAGILLLLFYLIDSYYYKKEGLSKLGVHIRGIILTDKTKEKGDIEIDEIISRYKQETHKVERVKERLRVRGLPNGLLLIGVMGGVLFSGLVRLPEVNILGIPAEAQDLIRDAFLILLGIISFRFTPHQIHKDNGFTWFPIKEVAYLFAGIFTTIVPALILLRAGESGNLGFLIKAIKEPWHYFWITGGLSSFLDNTPTYLTFFSTVLGRFYPGVPESTAVARLIAEHHVYLEAIATGAVFMGAMTYIGNAPNFMVKSISEENNIKMPSFFGYMGYSIVILIPIYILSTFIFLR
ncbi:citrate transporter [bacterium BMS3Abin05]|nr:citrate transporter [bacterium BMS3Abin05]GBE27058.1 citrate transporter [bacterium BMS3Bbin03]